VQFREAAYTVDVPLRNCSLTHSLTILLRGTTVLDALAGAIAGALYRHCQSMCSLCLLFACCVFFLFLVSISSL